MGGAINSAGSLGLSRATGEVSNTSTADDLVGGLNVPEVGVEFGGISVSSVSNRGGYGPGWAWGIIRACKGGNYKYWTWGGRHEDQVS